MPVMAAMLRKGRGIECTGVLKSQVSRDVRGGRRTEQRRARLTSLYSGAVRETGRKRSRAERKECTGTGRRRGRKRREQGGSRAGGVWGREGVGRYGRPWERQAGGRLATAAHAKLEAMVLRARLGT